MPIPDQAPTARFTLGVWATLIAAALAAVALFLVKGNPAAHDFEFHVSNWHEISQQWRAGVFFPRWAADANFGAGEPRFVFYPPMAPMLGAVLSLIFPMVAVPAEFAFLVLLAAGCSMFWFARDHLSPKFALLAAVAYVVNPYHLITLYWDFRVAELLASAIFPLLLLALHRASGGKSIAPTALCIAAIWLSNGPAGVMAMYTAALLIGLLAFFLRDFGFALRGAGALVAGLGLAAFYLLPALWEKDWIHLRGLFAPGLSVSENFLFSVSADGPHTWFNFLVSEIAVEEMILFGVAALAIIFLHRRKIPAALATALALGTVASLMMFHLSAWAWRLPELEFMQFPWRWMLVLNLVLCFVGAYALSRAKMQWLWVFALLIFLGYTGRNVLRQASWGRHATSELAFATAPIGYRGTKEYTPAAASVPKLLFARTEEPQAWLECDLAPCGESSVSIERWWPDRRKFLVKTPQPALLRVHTFDYPAWDAKLDHLPVAIAPDRKTGDISVAVPPGEHEVRLKFHRTADRFWGGILSFATALALAGCELFGRFRRRRSFPNSSAPAPSPLA